MVAKPTGKIHWTFFYNINYTHKLPVNLWQTTVPMIPLLHHDRDQLTKRPTSAKFPTVLRAWESATCHGVVTVVLPVTQRPRWLWDIKYQTSFLHSSEWTHHQTIKSWPWKETHHFKMKQDHKIICLVVSDHWNTCPLLKHPFLGIKKHQWHQLSIGSCSVHVKMILNH
jgi:hypothetical protein